MFAGAGCAQHLLPQALVDGCIEKRSNPALSCHVLLLLSLDATQFMRTAPHKLGLTAAALAGGVGLVCNESADAQVRRRRRRSAPVCEAVNAAGARISRDVLQHAGCPRWGGGVDVGAGGVPTCGGLGRQCVVQLQVALFVTFSGMDVGLQDGWIMLEYLTGLAAYGARLYSCLCLGE